MNSARGAACLGCRRESYVEREPELFAKRRYLEEKVVGIRRGLTQLQIARPYLVRPRGRRSSGPTRQRRKRRRLIERPRIPPAAGREALHDDLVALTQGAIELSSASIRRAFINSRRTACGRHRVAAPLLGALADADEMQPVARRERSLPALCSKSKSRSAKRSPKVRATSLRAIPRNSLTEQEGIAERRRICVGGFLQAGGHGRGVALQRVAARALR